ncbi:hypothetical protein HNP38_003445 [Chryseobacterium defluvii]|uniref:Uncharacterized protein n=1 Tax=Chryseobacterium defluvii TaxID=160396 RepID=A0A840KHC4_9FLAO|nr:hypothetical protein [Chryseobacterium defluvii]MBB4808105.1 hypothetical protein [Chryseobacterium defluvii]
MELLDIILGKFIPDILGLYTRYFVLKIFNPDLKKEDLDQGFFNLIIGLVVFIGLLIGILYVLSMMKIL